MLSRSMRVVSIALVLLAVAGQQPAKAAGLDVGGMLGGSGGLMNMIPNTLNSATSMVSGLTTPLMGALSPMTGGLTGGLNGMLSQTLGGLGTLTGGQTGLIGNTMRLATGSVTGLTSGMAQGLGGLASSNGALPTAGAPVLVSSPNGLASNLAVAVHPNLAAAQAVNRAAMIGQTPLIRNNFKREAIPEGAMLGAAHDMMAGAAIGAASGAMAGAAAESAALDTVAGEAGLLAGSATGALAAGAGAIAAGAGAMAAGAGAAMAAGAGASSAAVNSAAAANVLAGPQASLLGRQALAADAIRNAQAESAAAGAEMVQNGAINARSASMASNAYRQAKLAGARDRVNIAGTIQNSARISDAAIATHDTATKAEDSLLGSELAVDSAATVFDSDGAYIPPVTASLLRSLPYGRLGLRNIIPKPLTHPSVMLPDVWLNGVPVNYQNIPLRMLPYGIGPAQSINSLLYSQTAAANGAIINGQPFIANNGMVLNGLVFDPAFAYLTGANINGIIGSSLLPILANGQLEAQDELAMANLLNMQQLNGIGMSSTYQGYGRLNPVPMITGSVSDVNLMPTTTIGTTYPIGSALVIEPRDSYFQDYTDNASSRQNFDERQQ